MPFSISESNSVTWTERLKVSPVPLIPPPHYWLRRPRSPWNHHLDNFSRSVFLCPWLHSITTTTLILFHRLQNENPDITSFASTYRPGKLPFSFILTLSSFLPLFFTLLNTPTLPTNPTNTYLFAIPKNWERNNSLLPPWYREWGAKHDTTIAGIRSLEFTYTNSLAWNRKDKGIENLMSHACVL